MPATYGGTKGSFIRHAFESNRSETSSVLLSPTKHQYKKAESTAAEQNVDITGKISFVNRTRLSPKRVIEKASTNGQTLECNSKHTDLAALFGCLDDLPGDEDRNNDERVPKRRKTTFFAAGASKYYNPDEKLSDESSSEDLDTLDKEMKQDSRIDESIGTIIKQLSDDKRDSNGKTDLNKARALKVARYTTFVRNMSLKGRTYETTRSFRADKRTISDDDESTGDENTDDGYTDNRKDISSKSGDRSGDKVLSTLDLRISGINAQNKEELDLFVEGYEAERLARNRKDILEEFLQQIHEQTSFAKYLSTRGFPIIFLNQSLRKDCSVESISGIWVRIFLELLKPNANCATLTSYCRVIPNQPKFILTLLHSDKVQSRSNMLEVLSILCDISADFDITKYFNEEEKSGFIKELRTCIENPKLSVESTDHCLKIYHQMVLTGNVSDEVFFFKLTLSIMKFVRDHTGCESRKLVSILKLGISLTSSLNEDDNGLRKRIRDVLFNSEIFTGLIEIAESNMKSRGGDQLSLFALGYLVNFADESKYLEKCNREIFKRLKKLLHAALQNGSDKTSETHVKGYLALVYGKLLTYKFLKADLDVGKKEKEKIVNVLKEFKEMISPNAQVEKKVDAILRQLV